MSQVAGVKDNILILQKDQLYTAEKSFKRGA